MEIVVTDIKVDADGRRVGTLFVRGRSPHDLRAYTKEDALAPGYRRPLMDFDRDGNLRLRGRVAGLVSNGGVAFGGDRFAIIVRKDSDPFKGNAGLRDVRVEQEGHILVEGRGIPLCDDIRSDTDADLEIRRRVMFYLAWRQLLRPDAGNHAAP